MIKVRWTAWLHPFYLWLRIKWFFGWRPKWVRKILNQKIRPDVMLMDEGTYKDFLSWNHSLIEVEKIIEDNSTKEVK